MAVVREAIVKSLRMREEERNNRPMKPGYKPRIWPSDMLGCRRKLALRLQGVSGESDYTDETLDAFRHGSVEEDHTLDDLRRVYGHDNVRGQLWLGNDLWSGYSDMIIGHETNAVIVVEHKATSNKYFNYNDKLPEPKHLAQLLLYGKLYGELYNVKPQLILFYRAWTSWAEFEVVQDGPYVHVWGEIDGVWYEDKIAFDLEGEIAALEAVFYDRDTLPGRLANMEDGCTFRDEPSCPYYEVCWG